MILWICFDKSSDNVIVVEKITAYLSVLAGHVPAIDGRYCVLSGCGSYLEELVFVAFKSSRLIRAASARNRRVY